MSNIYNLDNISKVIRETRKAIGISQEQLSKECSVSRSTVIKWEQGKIEPDMHSLLTMCNLFDCELGYLLGEEGYEDGKRTVTDICKATGLSRLAVENLIKIKKDDERLEGTLDIDLGFISFMLEKGYFNRSELFQKLSDNPSAALSMDRSNASVFLYDVFTEANQNYVLHLLSKYIDLALFESKNNFRRELKENNIMDILFRGVLIGNIDILKEGIGADYDFSYCVEDSERMYGADLNDLISSYGRAFSRTAKKQGEKIYQLDPISAEFMERSNPDKNLSFEEMIRGCVLEDWSNFEFKEGERETILYYMYFASEFMNIDGGFRRYKLNEVFILTLEEYKEYFLAKKLGDKQNG